MFFKMLKITKLVTTIKLNAYLQLQNIRRLSKTSVTLQVVKPYIQKKSNKTIIGPFGWFLLIIPTSTFCLGTWQMQRKKWKENLIIELHDRAQMQPIKLPATLDELDTLEYHPIHVKGTFLHEKEIYMGPRTLLEKGDASTTSALMSKNQNKSQGYLVITPFKLADRDETILINRGWVPAKKLDPKTRINGQVEGVTDVIGVVRLHENRPNFMPANREKGTTWFYRDLDHMSTFTGSSPIYLDATKDFQVTDGPISGQTRISLRNEHLSYIITWYSLCGLTSFMWYKQFIKLR